MQFDIAELIRSGYTQATADAAKLWNANEPFWLWVLGALTVLALITAITEDKAGVQK